MQNTTPTNNSSNKGDQECNLYSPHEIEMSRCPQCDHSIPTLNMTLHQATICGNHSSNSSSTARRQRQTKERPTMSHSNIFNASIPDVDQEYSAQLKTDDGDALLVSSPPRSRARTSLSQPIRDRNHFQYGNPCPHEEYGDMIPRGESDIFAAIQPSAVSATYASTSSSPIESNNGTNREEEVIEIGDSDSDEDEIIEEQWACSRCTLHNPMDTHTCNACGFTQASNTNNTRATYSNDGIRNPDPTRREQLIGPNGGGDGYLNISMMDAAEMRAMALMQDSDYHPNPNNSVYRSIGGSAILGSAIGAISGLSRNRGFISSAVEGAVAGAVGGALSHGLSRQGGNQNRNQSYFSPMGRSYRTGSSPGYRMVVMSSNGILRPPGQGHYVGMNIDSDAMDGMSYDSLLEAFGDGSENRSTDSSIIQSLPTTTLKDVEHELPKDYGQCCICLDEFENGQKRKTLPCLHG